jgi:hypothetical protein
MTVTRHPKSAVSRMRILRIAIGREYE